MVTPFPYTATNSGRGGALDRSARFCHRESCDIEVCFGTSSDRPSPGSPWKDQRASRHEVNSIARPPLHRTGIATVEITNYPRTSCLYAQVHALGSPHSNELHESLLSVPSSGAAHPPSFSSTAHPSKSLHCNLRFNVPPLPCDRSNRPRQRPTRPNSLQQGSATRRPPSFLPAIASKKTRHWVLQGSIMRLLVALPLTGIRL